MISALDESGRPVDWWFMYKVPHMAGSGPGASSGYQYVYYDTVVGKVVVSPYEMVVDNGALDLTLDSIFNNPTESTGWILYNDEKPDAAKATPKEGDDGRLGHTKGVLAFDTASGTALWLLHSWPKFATPGSKTMPTPQYGQTYLCVTIDIATAGAIAAVMIDHQEPQVFGSRLPTDLAAADPLRLLASAAEPNAAGDSHVLDFTSKAGKAFKMIAKNRLWGGDFWNQLVGPAIGVCLDVETWIRVKKSDAAPDQRDSGKPGEITLDGSHEVFDIKAIDLTPLGAPWKWSESKDHAKWGIGVEEDWVCVGDINRMISQRKRGGGTIAFQDPVLWAALAKTDSVNPDGPTKPADGPPPLPATTTVSSTAAAASAAAVPTASGRAQPR